MRLGLKETSKHKVKGNQYLTLLCITDATKSAKTIKIPKWLRFPALFIVVLLVWKSLTLYEYVVGLEAQMANDNLAAQEALIESGSKDSAITQLETELNFTKETRYEQLVALKELAVKLGLRLEELENYRDAMEEYKQEIDNNINTDISDASGGDGTNTTTISEDLSLATKILQKSPVETITEFSTSAHVPEKSYYDFVPFDIYMTTGNEGGPINNVPVDLDAIDFESEVEKIYEYLDMVTTEVEGSQDSFEETTGSLEEIIPVLENYPGVLPIANTYITSYFGYRSNPFGGSRTEFHTGVDLKASYVSVSATAAGTVVEARYLAGYGYTVLIDHDNGLTTKYAHNSKLYVKVGDKVSRGDAISKSGNTGRSTGPHLHYEILLKGVPQNPLDYIYKEKR